MAEWKKEFGLYGYNLPTSSPATTPGFIRKLKSEGNWIALWYVHTVEMAEKYRDSPADAFVTGAPSALRKALGGE